MVTLRPLYGHVKVLKDSAFAIRNPGHRKGHSRVISIKSEGCSRAGFFFTHERLPEFSFLSYARETARGRTHPSLHDCESGSNGGKTALIG